MTMHAPSRAEKFWLFVFLAAWSFFGLTGRDAWKAEEAQALTPILDWLAHGGLATGSATPFHTLVSGLFAWATQSWFDPQDGARLASGALTLAALVLTALAAKRLFGPGYGAAAALALMGSFGLMLRAHALLPEIALLTGYAWLMFGVTCGRDDVGRSATAIALAGFVLTLSRGLPDLSAVLLIVFLPMLSPEWRVRSYRRSVVFGLAGLATLMLLWLLLLSRSGGHALNDWWTLFMAREMPTQNPADLLGLLSWFAWPVWPLALWTLWHEHRRLGRVPALHPVLAALLVTLALGLWPSHSGGGALPVLVPLALLAAHGVATLNRSNAQGFYWFGVLCFAFFAVAFWVYFAALQWGWPRPIALHLAHMTPGFHSHAGLGTILSAAAGTLVWLVVIPLFPRAKIRPILVWATGMALTWFLLIMLFRPWAEAGWGYRPMIADMARHLPRHACLRSEVDPAMATMLRLQLAGRYRPSGKCDYLITLDRRPRGDMTEVWEGYRPRDKNKRYHLFVTRAK